MLNMIKKAKDKEKNYCDFSEYIDECYVCKITGKPCELGFFPNKWECLLISRKKTRV